MLFLRSGQAGWTQKDKRQFLPLRRPVLAGLAELFDPAAQNAIVRLLEVKKLDPHADARLDDAHHAERFEFLVFPAEGNAHACVRGQRLTGADKNSTHREVRSHALGSRTGFQIQNDGVRGKRIADAEATVPEGQPPGFIARCAVIHENYVAHKHSRGSKLRGTGMEGGAPFFVWAKSGFPWRFEFGELAHKAMAVGHPGRPLPS